MVFGVLAHRTHELIAILIAGRYTAFD